MDDALLSLKLLHIPLTGQYESHSYTEVVYLMMSKYVYCFTVIVSKTYFHFLKYSGLHSDREIAKQLC